MGRTLSRRSFELPAAILVAFFTFAGCSKPKSSGDSSNSSSPEHYLYVASGACQAGANTTFTTTTASNLVYRVNLSTGNRDLTIADYNGVSGESPFSIVDFDDTHILVGIEKTGSRRIEKVERKLNGARANFSTDSAALSNTLLDMTKSKDGGVFVSRTNGIASISSAGVTQSVNYVGTTGGAAACGTTNTKYSSIGTTDMGHLIYLNSEASDNKVSIIKAGPSCLAGNTPSTPVAAIMTTSVYLPNEHQLIVANSGNTVAVGTNTISVYDVTNDATTATLSATATTLYDTFGFPATYNVQLYAVSAMAYDSLNHHLYVASANQIAANIATSGNYIIEKFAYDSAAKTLTRVGTTSFYPSGVDTKCISKMFIGI